jgi:hypothetical protein
MSSTTSSNSSSGGSNSREYCATTTYRYTIKIRDRGCIRIDCLLQMEIEVMGLPLPFRSLECMESWC